MAGEYKSYRSGAGPASSLMSDNSQGRSYVKYIYELPYTVLSDVSVLLDVNDKWKHLGGTYLGFTITDLLRIEQFSRHSDSPSCTMKMLLEWSMQNHTIVELFIHLSKMRMYHAMSILKDHVSPRYHHLLANPELHGELAFGAGPMESAGACGSLGYASATETNDYAASGNCRPADYLPKPPLPLSSSSSSASTSQSYQQQQQHHRNKQVPVQDTAYDYYDYSYVTQDPTSCGSYDQQNIWSRNLIPHENNGDLTCQYKTLHINPDNLDRPSMNVNDQPRKKMFTDVAVVGGGIGDESTEKYPSNYVTGKGTSEFTQKLPRPPLPSDLHLKSLRSLPLQVESIEDNTALPSRMQLTKPDVEEIRASYAAAVDDAIIGKVPYSEIVEATNDFTTRELGRGGFGVVYEGRWKKLKVAIKRIEKKENPGLTSLEEAKLRQSYVELKTLNQCRYDNVLPLYGYAVDDAGSSLCLVYQYMVNGSLEDRLLRRNGTPPLTWMQRLSIARGSARGLQYLHSFEPRIIHGDIKSANILLDVNMEPKLGDFGLARRGPAAECTHTSVNVSAVHGTQPYLPTDYIRSRQLSTKVDTYSFGVVLLELATGSRAYADNRPKRKFLRDYVADYDTAKYDELRDRSGDDDCNDCNIFLFLIHEGRRCTSSKKKDRPEMADVFEYFDVKFQAVESCSKHSDHQMDTPLESIATVQPQLSEILHQDESLNESNNVGSSNNLDVSSVNQLELLDSKELSSNAPSNDMSQLPWITVLGTKPPSP